MLNHIIIQGRLTGDPEMCYTKSETQVASFTLACARDFGKETDFIDCTAWRKTAEFVDKYFHKGDMCLVSGRLQFEDWTDASGSKRRNAKVVVDSVHFCGAKKDTAEVTFKELSEDADGELPF